MEPNVSSTARQVTDDSDEGIAELLVFGFGGGQRPHLIMRTVSSLPAWSLPLISWLLS